MKPNMKSVSNPPALSKMGGNVRTARAGSIKKDRAAGIGSVPNTKGAKSLDTHKSSQLNPGKSKGF